VKITILGTILGAACLLLTGCNQASPVGGGPDLLAVVNDDPISKEEHYAYLQRKQTVQVNSQQGPTEARVVGSMGLQAMRDLINRRLILQTAKDLGVAPTKADIEKELEFQQKLNPNFVKALTGAGLTLEQIKSDLTVDLSRFNILTKGITVTPADVDKYIRENPDDFKNPATVELYWIFLQGDRNKAEVDKQLRDGFQFPLVASRLSEAPDARQTSGRYPVELTDRLPAPVRTIVDKAKVGTPTDWVKDGSNWARFFVQNKTPASDMKIDDTMKERVRRAIMEQRGNQANDLANTLSDSLMKAKVEVKVPYLRDLWKQAVDTLKSREAAEASGN